MEQKDDTPVKENNENEENKPEEKDEKLDEVSTEGVVKPIQYSWIIYKFSFRI